MTSPEPDRRNEHLDEIRNIESSVLRNSYTQGKVRKERRVKADTQAKADTQH